MKCVHTMGDVLDKFGVSEVANNALRPLLGEAMDLMYRVCPTAGNTNTTLMARPPSSVTGHFAPSLPCSLTEDPAEMMKEWRVLVKTKLQLTQDQQIRTAKRRAELLIKLGDIFKKRGNTASQVLLNNNKKNLKKKKKKLKEWMNFLIFFFFPVMRRSTPSPLSPTAISSLSDLSWIISQRPSPKNYRFGNRSRATR
jgi:hypothetical protein